MKALALLFLILAHWQPEGQVAWEELRSGYQRQFNLQVRNFIRLPDGRIFDRQNELQLDEVKKKNRAVPSDTELSRSQILGPVERYDDTRETRRWGLVQAEHVVAEPPPLWWSPDEEIASPTSMPRIKVVQVLDPGRALIDSSTMMSTFGAGDASGSHITDFKVSYAEGLPQDIADGVTLEGPFIRLPCQSKTYQYESLTGSGTVRAWLIVRETDLQVLSAKEIYDSYLSGEIEISEWRCKETRERRGDAIETVYRWARIPKAVQLPKPPEPDRDPKGPAPSQEQRRGSNDPE